MRIYEQASTSYYKHCAAVNLFLPLRKWHGPIEPPIFPSSHLQIIFQYVQHGDKLREYQGLVTIPHEGWEHLVQDADFATGCYNLFVNPKLSILGHREFKKVRMIATFTQHHVYVGELDINKRELCLTTKGNQP